MSHPLRDSSQGLLGWASSPPGRPNWGRKWTNFEEKWEKLQESEERLRKSCSHLAHPGVRAWLRSCNERAARDKFMCYKLHTTKMCLTWCMTFFFSFVKRNCDTTWKIPGKIYVCQLMSDNLSAYCVCALICLFVCLLFIYLFCFFIYLIYCVVISKVERNVNFNPLNWFNHWVDLLTLATCLITFDQSWKCAFGILGYFFMIDENLNLQIFVWLHLI